jgi:hypothetical protein
MIMLIVMKLNVIMTSAVILSVIKLSAIMLIVRISYEVL